LDDLENMGFEIEDASTEEYYNFIQEGAGSMVFRQLVAGLVKQHLPSESVNLNVESQNQFTSEINQFLKAKLADSPYAWNEISRMNFESKLSLLEYLKAECQSLRIIESSGVTSMDVGNSNSVDNERIRKMCKVLNVPPSEDNAKNLNLICSKLKGLLQTLPKNYLGQSLLRESDFKDSHMKILEEMNSSLKEEYEQRKQVLLKRLDVTLQSFLWSDKGEEYEHELKPLVKQNRAALKTTTNISVYDVFAAHTDITRVVKTSSQEVTRAASASIRSQVVGVMPVDRGGRVMERRSEMPAFAPRVETEQSKPQRGNAGKKSRVQGSWSGGGDKGKGKKSKRGRQDQY